MYRVNPAFSQLAREVQHPAVLEPSMNKVFTDLLTADICYIPLMSICINLQDEGLDQKTIFAYVKPTEFYRK